jgi:hypothetical protein
MVLVFVTLGQYLDAESRRRALALLSPDHGGARRQARLFSERRENSLSPRRPCAAATSSTCGPVKRFRWTARWRRAAPTSVRAIADRGMAAPPGGGRRLRQRGIHGRGRRIADPRIRHRRDARRPGGTLCRRSARPPRADRSGGGSRHRHIHSGGVGDRRRQLLRVGIVGRLGAGLSSGARSAGRGLSLRLGIATPMATTIALVHRDRAAAAWIRSGAVLEALSRCVRWHSTRPAPSPWAGRPSFNTASRRAHARESPTTSADCGGRGAGSQPSVRPRAR